MLPPQRCSGCINAIAVVVRGFPKIYIRMVIFWFSFQAIILWWKNLLTVPKQPVFLAIGWVGEGGANKMGKWSNWAWSVFTPTIPRLVALCFTHLGVYGEAAAEGGRPSYTPGSGTFPIIRFAASDPEPPVRVTRLGLGSFATSAGGDAR